MTRKTALRRMLAGKMVYHESNPNVVFFYDESQEKDKSQSIRVCKSDGEVISGVLAFFFLPNLGWKEYRPEEKCQNQEQS